MAKKFAVVTFPKENDEHETVSEVPSSWLSSNLTKCWWPSVKNANPYIIKQIPPVTNDPKKWSLYPIIFHRYCGKLYFTSEQNLCNCFLIFFKNNVISKFRICPNQDSLEEARRKATNYSSSEESSTNNAINYKSHTEQLNKTVSDDESESDSSDSRSIIPNPPNLTNINALQSINTNQSISNILNSSVVNDIDMEILDGTLVPHKSKFYFKILLFNSLLLFL